jgi:hypothetical protein
MRPLRFVPIFFLSLVLPALAGGSASFHEDVLPLLQRSPEQTNVILQKLDFSDTGSAVRIGRKACPALDGARIAPYEFEAKEKGSQAFNLRVVINTNINFYDHNGRLVFQVVDGIPDENSGSLYGAESFGEEVSSIIIERKRDGTQ